MAVNPLSLFDRFDSDDKCRKYLEDLRWPAGIARTQCGDMAVSEIESRGQWACLS